MTRIDWELKKLNSWTFERFNKFVGYCVMIYWNLDRMEWTRLGGAIGGKEATSLDDICEILDEQDFIKAINSIEQTGIPYSSDIKKVIAELRLILGHYQGTNSMPQTNVRRMGVVYRQLFNFCRSVEGLIKYLNETGNKTWE